MIWMTSDEIWISRSRNFRLTFLQYLPRAEVERRYSQSTSLIDIQDALRRIAEALRRTANNVGMYLSYIDRKMRVEGQGRTGETK
jgi:hypothetical protein